MNQQERNWMREKHYFEIYTEWGDDEPTIECVVCGAEYPCDVIQVLDAWERTLDSKQVEPQIASTCQHQHLSTVARMAEMGYPCPKCGEKL